MSSLAQMLAPAPPERVEVMADIFVRLLYYFHKRPIDQRYRNIGEVDLAVLSMLLHHEPLTWRDKDELTSKFYDRSSIYSTTSYSITYCINCGGSYNLPVRTQNPFAKACQECSSSEERRHDRVDVPCTPASWHFYNPCSSVFNKLESSVQQLVLDKLDCISGKKV